jgi:hypothetical protein
MFRRISHHFSLAVAFGITSLLASGANGQVRLLHVDVNNGSPTGNGSGWDQDAFMSLQDALAEAKNHLTSQPSHIVHIWVAQGTYYPDRDAGNPNGTGDRDARFELRDRIFIYGGFSGDGSETDRNQRDPYAYETILSGDIGQTGVKSDNSCNILWWQCSVLIDTSTICLVDGFTIRDGYSVGGNCNGSGAAGWFETVNMRFARCTFVNIEAEFTGGAH